MAAHAGLSRTAVDLPRALAGVGDYGHAREEHDHRRKEQHARRRGVLQATVAVAGGRFAALLRAHEARLEAGQAIAQRDRRRGTYRPHAEVAASGRDKGTLECQNASRHSPPDKEAQAHERVDAHFLVEHRRDEYHLGQHCARVLARSRKVQQAGGNAAEDRCP